MEDPISKIVRVIVDVCKSRGEAVSEKLAAFFAKTVVINDAGRFQLDTEMTEEDLNDLVQIAAQRLMKRNDPSCETLKMQVAFDTAYVENEEMAAQERVAVENKAEDVTRVIVETQPRTASDFDTLNELYRKVFHLLLIRAGMDAKGDRMIEREIQAALESVFPRIGLNTFVAMTPDEKRAQLRELSNIVLGIRLFNREIGKGGVGIDDIPGLALRESRTLLTNLEKQHRNASVECSQYRDVLHLAHQAPETLDGLNPGMISRWRQELTNRQQFASYTANLLEDVSGSHERINQLCDSFLGEMTDLKGLVGSRTTVPKEQVYPKFDALATIWDNLSTQRKLVRARETTMDILKEYQSSYSGSLGVEWVTAARQVLDKAHEDGKDILRIGAGKDLTVEVPEGKEDAPAEVFPEEKESKEFVAVEDGDVPTKLFVDTTPEFMQLPLQYQGFCPWSVVKRNGLLLPGNPALGVVRYQKKFYVFSRVEAMDDFMKNPVMFIEGVKEMATNFAELVFLLRLQTDFPGVSIPPEHYGMPSPKKGAVSGQMRDASTETPTHFIEKNLNPMYEWNEWGLRRRALRMADIRKCRTSSAQTDDSSFRREIETQVYMPREGATQTGISQGTNPIKQVRYVTGLRGDGGVPLKMLKPSETSKGKIAVVELQFDQ